MRLADKTVLITGAGSGIGRTTAERCAEEGAHVVVTDVDVEGGEETVAMVKELDAGSAEFRELDVTDYEAVEAVVDDVAAERGLDVLVANAGVGHLPTKVENTSTAERDQVIDVNLKGVWNCSKAAAPAMVADGGGSIVNVSSVAGVIGAPRLATYSLSKGGVLNFSKAVAAEYGSDGVRVNAVCPSFAETPMTEQFFDIIESAEGNASRETIARQHMLGRLAEVDEIADAILFLASDESSFVTGHGLLVDGGMSAF